MLQISGKIFVQTKFWPLFAFKILFLASFYNVKTTNLAVFCFLQKYESEKKNAKENRFWVKFFTATETFTQFFHKMSLFHRKFLQRVRFRFNIFATHQVFKYNCVFVKSNSVSKLAFEKTFLLAPLHRKNVKDGSIIFPWGDWIWEKNWNRNFFWKKFFTSESSNQHFRNWSDFEWRFSQRVIFWFNNFTMHQVFIQFLNQEFITSETYNQQFHKSSDFECRLSQRVRFWFNNITKHHNLKFNIFLKSKSVTHLVFRENVNLNRKSGKVAFSVPF